MLESYVKSTKLKVPVLLFLLFGISSVCARKKKEKAGLRFSDCGNTPLRPIRFYDVSANPMPIVTPGTLYVSLTGNVTHDLPRRISVELVVKKYLIGIPFMLPCFLDRIGSCTYENICSYLDQYKKRRCPRTLRHHKMRCHCPFLAGDFSFKDIPLNIPKIGGFAGAFVNGDYEVVFRFLDENKDELGCLEVKFSMKKRHRGWLFKI